MQTNGTKAQSRVTAIKIQRRIIYSSYRNFDRARRSNRFNGKLHEIINIHTHECLFYGAHFSRSIYFDRSLFHSPAFYISRWVLLSLDKAAAKDCFIQFRFNTLFLFPTFAYFLLLFSSSFFLFLSNPSPTILIFVVKKHNTIVCVGHVRKGLAGICISSSKYDINLSLGALCIHPIVKPTLFWDFPCNLPATKVSLFPPVKVHHFHHFCLLFSSPKIVKQICH